MCVCVCVCVHVRMYMLSRVQLCNPMGCRTAARQAPLSVGILQSRIQECIAVPSSRGSS